MPGDARHTLETGVGLALLGVQRWLSVRGDIEEELDRAGLGPAADLSRRVGEAVAGGLTRLILSQPLAGAPRSRPAPPL